MSETSKMECMDLCLALSNDPNDLEASEIISAARADYATLEARHAEEMRTEDEVIKHLQQQNDQLFVGIATLRATIERQAAEMQAREASYMDALATKSIRIDEQATLIESLRYEVKQLNDWKESAIQVDSLWEPMRRFAKEHGARLGHSIAEESARIANELEAENKTLHAKMTTMVCGTCFGKKGRMGIVHIEDKRVAQFKPCLVCQSAKGGA